MSQARECLGFFFPSRRYNRAVHVPFHSQRWLITLVAAGMIGLLADLLLIGHDEDALQLIPLIALALASTALIVRLFSDARWLINIATVILILMAASGALGLRLHYRANATFQQEMDPSLAGIDLLWKTLQTKSPPAVAPGQMVLLSLLALIIIRQPTPSHQGHQS